MLVETADYLHHRSAGMIGSRSHLICGAAIDAIITGDEKITRAGLDAVELEQVATPKATGRVGRAATAPPDHDPATAAGTGSAGRGRDAQVLSGPAGDGHRLDIGDLRRHLGMRT